MLTSSPKLYRARMEIMNWLNQHEWQYFVTLASNTAGLRPTVMRTRFRMWDALANRKILGRRSLKPDERLFTAAFLERPTNNPHWHLLIRIQQPELPEAAKCPARLETTSLGIWKKLTPSGSVDAQSIHDQKKMIEYVAKELMYPIQYENMILPLEFSRH